MKGIIIECDHVGLNLDGRRVVDDLSLAISPGINYLIGPNGSGKSSLLQLLTTVVQPTEGSVVYFERGSEQVFDYRKMATLEVRKVSSYVPQALYRVSRNER